MKKALVFILFLTVSLVSAQDDLAWGTTAYCEAGGEITDGVEVMVVNQRAGNSYTVTALGLNGFDPVLAVAFSENLGASLCNDDNEDAAYYQAWLPTTGEVEASNLTSQIVFNLNNIDTDFANLSFVVGSVTGEAGEFILIVEGMYAAPNDGAGDPMSLLVSDALLASEVYPTAYMVSVTSGLDSTLYLINSDYEYLFDDDGNWYGCDNAGYEGCFGENGDLTGYYVSRTEERFAQAWEYDSMLNIPINENWLGTYINYTFAGVESEGDYVAAFHLGWAGEYAEEEE